MVVSGSANSPIPATLIALHESPHSAQFRPALFRRQLVRHRRHARSFGAATPIPTGSWPRHIKLSNALVVVYQPQINSWTDNRLDFRSALAIKPDGGANEAFGVVFVTARTNVDKTTHRVALDNMQITKSDFPTLPDHGAAYVAELRRSSRRACAPFRWTG